jgi:hypothetical protein
MFSLTPEMADIKIRAVQAAYILACYGGSLPLVLHGKSLKVGEQQFVLGRA